MIKTLTTSLLATATFSLVAGAAHADPLDIEKYREVLLDPLGQWSLPQPDPAPAFQVWEIPLPTDSLIPQWVWDTLKTARETVSKLGDWAPQDAIDIVNELTKLEEIRTKSFIADALVSMHADPGTGDFSAGGFASLRFGSQEPLMVSGTARYEGKQYIVDLVLHGWGLQPIDIHQALPIPTKFSDKIDNTINLTSGNVANLISFSLDLHYSADVSVDVGPLRGSIDLSGGGELTLTINGRPMLLAEDHAHASAVTRLEYSIFLGAYACGDWNLNNQLALPGLDNNNPASFSLGDTECSFNPPWAPK